MAFCVVMKKRCEECGRINVFRRPRSLRAISLVAQSLPCHYCHPEALQNCCASCRFPFSLVPHHSNGLCTTCAVAEHRWQKRLRATPLQGPAPA